MTITDAEKAGWAVAHAKVKNAKEFVPALRRAYASGAVPVREDLEQALRVAREMVAALESGLQLLEQSSSLGEA